MANYKEIVTKAVIGKGKKTFTSTSTIVPDVKPTTILGCWVINHNFKGIKEDGKIKIDGSYDINVWYSYDNNTKTDVVRKNSTYQEVVQLNKKEELDSDDPEEIIVRSLKQPTVIQADINDGTIIYTIEKELGIEIVGNTKVKIVVDEDEEEWDVLDDGSDEELDEDTNKKIDDEVVEEFLDDQEKS